MDTITDTPTTEPSDMPEYTLVETGEHLNSRVVNAEVARRDAIDAQATTDPGHAVVPAPRATLPPCGATDADTYRWPLWWDREIAAAHGGMTIDAAIQRARNARSDPFDVFLAGLGNAEAGDV